MLSYLEVATANYMDGERNGRSYLSSRKLWKIRNV